MAPTNAELIRAVADAFNEGGIEAAARFFADDVEFHEPPEQPAPRTARGRDELVRLFGEFDEAWTEHRSEIEELRELDEDRVLVFSVERFQGRDGMEVDAPAAAVFTIEAGRVVSWQAFWDRDRALEAATSPPQAGTPPAGE